MLRSLCARWLAALSLLTGGIVLLHAVTHTERVPLRRPLRDFPAQLGSWQSAESPLEARIVEAAGVDDYLNRAYTGPDGRAVGLYIGYYGSQRTGDAIHSPKNCLPGAGWAPVRASQLRVEAGPGVWVNVSEYVVRKGADTQLVLYWYQARGRTIAGEYKAKLWMAHDAALLQRTDAALVRVAASADDGESQARERAVAVVRLVFPHLRDFVPD
jgi:EpsI family protein